MTRVWMKMKMWLQRYLTHSFSSRSKLQATSLWVLLAITQRCKTSSKAKRKSQSQTSIKPRRIKLSRSLNHSRPNKAKLQNHTPPLLRDCLTINARSKKNMKFNARKKSWKNWNLSDPFLKSQIKLTKFYLENLCSLSPQTTKQHCKEATKNPGASLIPLLVDNACFPIPITQISWTGLKYTAFKTTWSSLKVTTKSWRGEKNFDSRCSRKKKCKVSQGSLKLTKNPGLWRGKLMTL